MGQELSLIKIHVDKISQLREGMGHIIEAKDHL
jgi:hypothetical protein